MPRPPPESVLPPPAHSRAGPAAAGGTNFAASPGPGVGMGPEAVEPVQVAFAALPLGRSGPQIGGARPSPGGASVFSSFLCFWGGVSFTFGERSGLESCTPRSGVLPDSPTPFLLQLPRRQLPGASVSGARRWRLGAGSRCGSRSPGSQGCADPRSAAAVLEPPTPSSAPGPSAGAPITPRATFRERAGLRMAPAF